jgi:TolB protein
VVQANNANALDLRVTKGSYKPHNIAIAMPVGKTPTEKRRGHAIRKILINDLAGTGLFNTLQHQASIQKFSSNDDMPDYASWQAVEAKFLLVTEIEYQGVSKIISRFRLYDVLQQRELKSLELDTSAEDWRYLAHTISNIVYEKITGDKGYFNTKVVFVEQKGNPRKPIKRLAMMDYDGANIEYLTDGRVMALTPRFSLSKPLITFMSYYKQTPHVFILNVKTGAVEPLGEFKGMTFAPRFSPLGNKLIFSLANKGNSDIFTMDLASRKVNRLTKHPGIDTSASFSPDQKRIVFNSDRHGSQQLYTMTANGKNISRISHGKGRYGTPVWSPRGDLIAFTKQQDSHFHIGVMRPDGTGERLLTKSYLDEAPTWSPNGRMIMFFRETPARDDRGRGRSSKIYMIDITGNIIKQVKTPRGASDPAWSGFSQS